MNAGIDKLILTTNDFIIKDVNKLGQNRNIKQGISEDESLPVLVVNNGDEHEYIRANSLFYNTDFYNVSVNKIGLQVAFNPSKVLHQYELAGIKEAKQVVAAVQKNMSEAGILFEPLRCSVSRLDLAKQIVPERSINAYVPAFAFLRGKRMKGVQYESGYRWGNKQHENTIYDKSIESNLPFPNLLRNEVKTKTTAATKRMTGIHTLSNIYDASDTHLTSFYNEYLNTKLFKGTIQTQMIIDFDSEVHRLVTLKKQGRNALLKFLAATGIHQIVRMAGTPEIIFEIMKQAGYSRKQIAQERKTTIKDLLSFSDLTDVDVKVLIHELKTMFAA